MHNLCISRYGYFTPNRYFAIMENKEDNNQESALIEYQKELNLLFQKSQDAFEKQLSFISAGALGISFTFLKGIIGTEEPKFKWMLAIAWAMLVLTLILNCLSHNFAARQHNAGIGEIRKTLYGGINAYDHVLIEKRNRCISIINYCNIILLLIGIASMTVFVYLNI